MKDLLIAAALLMLAPLFAGCGATKRVDAIALFKPAQVAWDSVEEELTRGVQDGLDDAELDNGAANDLLEQGDRLELALDTYSVEGVIAARWHELKPWAIRGIEDMREDGAIGTFVAGSLLERVDNFTGTIDRIEATPSED
jgi:hypothetical protein